MCTCSLSGNWNLSLTVVQCLWSKLDKKVQNHTTSTVFCMGPIRLIWQNCSCLASEETKSFLVHKLCHKLHEICGHHVKLTKKIGDCEFTGTECCSCKRSRDGIKMILNLHRIGHVRKKITQARRTSATPKRHKVGSTGIGNNLVVASLALPLLLLEENSFRTVLNVHTGRSIVDGQRDETCNNKEITTSHHILIPKNPTSWNVVSYAQANFGSSPKKSRSWRCLLTISSQTMRVAVHIFPRRLLSGGVFRSSGPVDPRMEVPRSRMARVFNPCRSP